MATIKLKVPSGGSVSLVAGDTASDVVFTIPPTTSTIVTSDVLAAPTGSGLVGANAYQTQDDVNNEYTTPLRHGATGDGVANDTASLLAMFASGAKTFDFLDKDYTFSITEGTTLAAFVAKQGIRIVGSGRLIDTRTYTTEPLTVLFSFDACEDCEVLLNYTGVPIVDKSNAITGIGYRGATFVNIKNGSKNITVNGNLKYLRYGVRSGDYVTWAQGYNTTIKTNLVTFECGYPIAHYLANDVQANLYSESSHRTAYIAGCHGGYVHALFKDQYIAPIQVLVTDAKTGVGTSRGTSNMDVIAHDRGSSIFVPNSHCAAINLSRVDAGTTFSNLKFDVNVKSSDTIATTLGGFRIDSTATAITHAGADLPYTYPFNWESSIYLTNIKVSGVVDRSQQTVAEHGSGEIYVYAQDTTAHIGTVRGLSFDNYTFIPGSATGSAQRGHWVFVPGLIGCAKFSNCDFSSDRPFYYASNANSLGMFSNCNLRGSYEASSDSPYLSAATFVNCTIAKQAFQPTINKTFVNTKIQAAGFELKQLFTELTLSGATTTWAGALPNNAIILGVTGYVTELITGATGYLCGTAATPSRFANTNTVTVGGTFNLSNGSDLTPMNQVGTGNIVLTAKTSNFTGGKIRLCVNYMLLFAPAS